MGAACDLLYKEELAEFPVGLGICAGQHRPEDHVVQAAQHSTGTKGIGGECSACCKARTTLRVPSHASKQCRNTNEGTGSTSTNFSKRSCIGPGEF